MSQKTLYKEPEPIPETLTKAQLANRSIEVGIVLMRDMQNTISIQSLNIDNPMANGTALGVAQAYEVTVEHGALVLKLDGHIVLQGKTIHLKCTPQSLRAEQGWHLNSVIAGRGFHWQKPIAVTLPGDLEITTDGTHLRVVNQVNYEDYLACVVVSEMSADTHPEFIKAQTIAARCWSVCSLGHRHTDENFDLCNDDHCQRYQGVTYANDHALQASIATAGYYIFHNDHVVPAYYSKCCGGQSANTKDTFGFALDSLQSVTDGHIEVNPKNLDEWINITAKQAENIHCASAWLGKNEAQNILGKVDDAQRYFRWHCTVPKSQIAENLTHRFDVESVLEVKSIEPIRVGLSGRTHVLDVHFIDTKYNEHTYRAGFQYEIRSLLHRNFLYSTAFTFEDLGEEIVFHGAGWGHGVGLCQMGAAFQAADGVDHASILKLYFPNASLEKVY